MIDLSQRLRLGAPRAIIGLAAVALLSSCGGGGCSNCTVPPFHGAPTAGGPALPPGFSTPAPTPVPPGFVPTPVASPTPSVALSCSQNAIVGSSVNLRSAAAFAVLAGSTVTSSGPTVVTGDLGVSPGTAITGFGPGTVIGTIHAGDPVAAQAQLDLTTAFNDAAGRVNPTLTPADIGGTVIPPGVYRAPVSLAITGQVTLDGRNDPNSVFIFQSPSTLTTATGSSVVLINAANACNVFWEEGSSATINGLTIFNGNVLALSSISLGTGATVNGRALARNGAVTMLSNVVTKTGP